MKPHKHAEVIKAWADGAEIEVRTQNGWKPVSTPAWDSDFVYRVKPEREYPKANFTKEEKEAIWKGPAGMLPSLDFIQFIGDAAIKRYIQDQDQDQEKE